MRQSNFFQYVGLMHELLSSQSHKLCTNTLPHSIRWFGRSSHAADSLYLLQAHSLLTCFIFFPFCSQALIPEQTKTLVEIRPLGAGRLQRVFKASSQHKSREDCSRPVVWWVIQSAIFLWNEDRPSAILSVADVVQIMFSALKMIGTMKVQPLD
jgi:hypothetical protein